MCVCVKHLNRCNFYHRYSLCLLIFHSAGGWRGRMRLHPTKLNQKNTLEGKDDLVIVCEKVVCDKRLCVTKVVCEKVVREGGGGRPGGGRDTEPQEPHRCGGKHQEGKNVDALSLPKFCSEPRHGSNFATSPCSCRSSLVSFARLEDGQNVETNLQLETMQLERQQNQQYASTSSWHEPRIHSAECLRGICKLKRQFAL